MGLSVESPLLEKFCDRTHQMVYIRTKFSFFDFHSIFYPIFRTTSNISVHRKEIHIVFSLVQYANFNVDTSSQSESAIVPFGLTDRHVVVFIKTAAFIFDDHSQKLQASMKHSVCFLKEISKILSTCEFKITGKNCVSYSKHGYFL